MFTLVKPYILIAIGEMVLNCNMSPITIGRSLGKPSGCAVVLCPGRGHETVLVSCATSFRRFENCN